MTFRSVVAFALFGALLASPVEARREWQAFGGGGDATIKLECPAGEVLVGFEGQADIWISQLRLLCAPRTGEFSFGNVHSMGDYLGAGGGGAVRAQCPHGSVVSLFNFVLMNDKRKLQRIALVCTSAGGGTGYAVLDGRRSNIDGGDLRTQACAPEQIVGVTVRYGRDINAIGAICDGRDWRPPPSPPVPVHTTGRRPAPVPAPAAPSGPPLALRATIAGSWKMTVGDRRGNLVLAPQNQGIDPFGRDVMPIAVSGALIDPDDDSASGTVQGVFQPGRVVMLSYVRKNGTNGTCQLNYEADGRRLIGPCVENGRNVEWGGFRGAWKPRAVPSPAAADDAPPPAAAGGGRSVTVKLDVDVFPAPGGEGNAIGSLNAGTPNVTLVGACKGDWCHVRWGGGDGWVYSGSDYNALGR